MDIGAALCLIKVNLGKGDVMDAQRVYALLQQACMLLEDAGDFHIAAHVGQAMALVEGRYAVGADHLAERDGALSRSDPVEHI